MPSTLDNEPRAAAGSATPHRDAPISIRNHDHRRWYHLRLSVARPDGQAVIEESYQLRPGETHDAGGALDPSFYEIRVELDRARVKRFEGRLEAAAGRRLHIETGNGVLSVTPGSY